MRNASGETNLAASFRAWLQLLDIEPQAFIFTDEADQDFFSSSREERHRDKEERHKDRDRSEKHRDRGEERDRERDKEREERRREREREEQKRREEEERKKKEVSASDVHIVFNPLTAPAPGWKVHTYTPANSISGMSVTNLPSILCIFVEVLSHTRAKQGESINDLALLLVVFWVTAWQAQQWKG